MNRRHLLEGAIGMATLAALESLAGCASAVTPDPSPPDGLKARGSATSKLDRVFGRIEERVAAGHVPGAVVAIARRDGILVERAFGKKVPGSDEPMTTDTLFDVQSMTKVMATAAAISALVQQGKLGFSDKVATHMPEFAVNGKGDVTVHQMLSYSAGLPVEIDSLDYFRPEEAFKRMMESPLEYRPGEKVLYSDLTYRLLGRLVQVISGESLDAFAQKHVWAPLGMKDTMFNPPESIRPRTAATGYSEKRKRRVRGEVQDEKDYALGGVAGCDGVFTTAKDTATFCRIFLNEGRLGSTTVFAPELVGEMSKNQTPQVKEADTDTSPLNNLLFAPKGYGWEMFTARFSTGGTKLSAGSYGKVGGGGTFMWIDPHRDLIAVYLTNHGLPPTMDEPGWERLLQNTGCREFFDGVIDALFELR